jgi:hypothetical protein
VLARHFTRRHLIKINNLNKKEILFIMDILNNIQLFGVFLIWSAGHLFASIIVAKYIYLPWVRKNELENIEPVVKYEDKFSLDDIKDTIVEPEDVSCNVYVSEHTPDGYVIMRYNNEEEGFEYWCDNSSIKYNYLEVVSRKYIDKLLCKNLYKDRMKKEEEKGEEIEEKEEEIEEKEEESDDVFVKSKISKENNNKKEERKISNVEGNKYIRKGKINELKIFKIEKKKKEPKKKMSFYDYKLLMKKKE